MTRLMALCSALLAGSTVAAGVWPDMQHRTTREDYNSGAYLYRAYCASCHGPAGRGDGPVADLQRRPPTDLTTLAQKRGTFSRSDVRAVLEGKRPLEAHSGPDMPAWREILLHTERGDERAVSARIEALVAHLELLQK
jgi:mono/diheme cytochrome c family protein